MIPIPPTPYPKAAQVCAALLIAGSLLLSPSLAQTRISGVLASDTLHASGNPYLVEGDISVPKGVRCVIAPGCALYFSPFTGIIVHGTLVVAGSDTQKVLFTSLNERPAGTVDKPSSPADTVAPAPFDWNGIDVLGGSISTTLRYADIRYTVNGIHSRTPYITINNCYFANTGQHDVIIDGTIYKVSPGTPFSYSPPDIHLLNQQPYPGNSGRPPFRFDDYRKQSRYGTAIVGAAGLVAGALFIVRAASDANRVNNMVPGIHTRQEVNDAKNSYSRNIKVGVAGFVLGSVGLGGFGLTFLIK
jgi:hypothetical protein